MGRSQCCWAAEDLDFGPTTAQPDYVHRHQTSWFIPSRLGLCNNLANGKIFLFKLETCIQLSDRLDALLKYKSLLRLQSKEPKVARIIGYPKMIKHRKSTV